MKSDIKKVVVLGAGTMGAQVAAHLVAQGLEVVLLDMVPPKAGDRTAARPKARRDPQEAEALARCTCPSTPARIRPGNFEDDWAQLKDADWVFEAVVEDLEVKRQLFARVAAGGQEDAPSSPRNTSGLGIGAMSAHLPGDFRQRFLGTHFFNPPRYLKLLETIPGPRDRPRRCWPPSEAFADRVLGKGVVRCKDTPNFIGNRIGSYGFGAALQAMQELDLTIEEVDTLTGPAIGRAQERHLPHRDIAGVDVVRQGRRRTSTTRCPTTPSARSSRSPTS